MSKAAKSTGVKAAVSKAVKEVNSEPVKKVVSIDSKLLDRFKKNKNLQNRSNFKPQTWIPLSQAFNAAIQLPGLPEGQVVMLRGLSDTGKTTALIEAAVSAQKMGKLPVFLITELKWSWKHVKTMGFKLEESVDEDTGEVIHTGDFIYADRSMLPSIESMGKFMLDLLNEQEKGKLPYDIVFLIDSLGSLPSERSIESSTNNPMWNSLSTSMTFSNFINFRFPLSRKTEFPFINTMICIVKQGIKYPMTPVEKPKRTSKGAESIYFDSGLVVDYGNISNSGTSKWEVKANGKTILIGKITKVSIDKNHVTNSAASDRLIMTDYGFIENTDKAKKKYIEDHSEEWLQELGATDFEIVEEAEVPEDFDKIPPTDEED